MQNIRNSFAQTSNEVFLIFSTQVTSSKLHVPISTALPSHPPHPRLQLVQSLRPFPLLPADSGLPRCGGAGREAPPAGSGLLSVSDREGLRSFKGQFRCYKYFILVYFHNGNNNKSSNILFAWCFADVELLVFNSDPETQKHREFKSIVCQFLITH